MNRAEIRAISYYLPESVLSNDTLAGIFSGWTPEKIAEKTGIVERRLVTEGECASDLAVSAATRLFDGGLCRPVDIDYLLLCTQSPDYALPATACVLQDRLGIPTTAGALDFNQGCSGFMYGLSLAKGLVETGQADNVLLLTAETYSRMLHPDDRSVRALFGDAAAATLVRGAADAPEMGPFVFGTDGRGAQNLIVRTGGARHPQKCGTAGQDKLGNLCSPDHVYMNGPEIFNFTLRTVPQSIRALLDKAGATMESVDRFVFHQANEYMLEHLRRKLNIPKEKFLTHLRSCGNTVSSTIPIVLQEAAATGELQPGQNVLMVGFGVGYSWAACMMKWPERFNAAIS